MRVQLTCFYSLSCSMPVEQVITLSMHHSFKVSLHCYLYKYAGGPSLQKPFKHSDLLVWFQVSEMRVCLLKKHRCQHLLGFSKQSLYFCHSPHFLVFILPYFLSRIHNILFIWAYECSMASGDSLTT